MNNISPRAIMPDIKTSFKDANKFIALPEDSGIVLTFSEDELYKLWKDISLKTLILRAPISKETIQLLQKINSDDIKSVKNHLDNYKIPINERQISLLQLIEKQKKKIDRISYNVTNITSKSVHNIETGYLSRKQLEEKNNKNSKIPHIDPECEAVTISTIYGENTRIHAGHLSHTQILKWQETIISNEDIPPPNGQTFTPINMDITIIRSHKNSKKSDFNKLSTYGENLSIHYAPLTKDTETRIVLINSPRPI